MPEISVEVQFHGRDSNPPLTIDHESITLTSSDAFVTWRLVAAPGVVLPTNAILMIRFDVPFGPFQAFRGIGSRKIMSQGINRESSPTSYTYFLYMLDPLEPHRLFRSSHSMIVNESSTGNRSPWLHIAFNESDLNEPPVIHPQPLFLHEGDTALVEITGVPEDHLVDFGFPQEPDRNLVFSTYFVTRKDGAGLVRLRGARFTSERIGQIEYGIKIWAPDGRLVASHDPSIDGLGKPPD